jgi:hypothetical protein
MKRMALYVFRHDSVEVRQISNGSYNREFAILTERIVCFLKELVLILARPERA